ncbi:metallophosphoesterase family protein [Parapedobacter koreensis]|uniref:Phosphoesterase, MJ0936 family n=1 Tax=Parapedobacter koreensis TaxID=332977 RepID=A0A1H7IFC8_9SPHI|nr:metallophosphoesterase family protein [Parapedobacter koreensis]SEK61148.1 phosphoesterase, MJ0936 family [Parapedobacter koreensis]
MDNTAFEKNRQCKAERMQTIEIAIISDIHANIIALEEAFDDIRKKGITQVYCLGDLVDFAPWGNEVIARIRDRGIPCILGNHDERIAYDQPIIPLAHHDSIETAHRELAIRFSKNTITDDNKKWLAELPFQLELTFKLGEQLKRILLVHASPRSNDEYVFESDPKEGLLDMLGGNKVDAIVMGHTHFSYVQHYAGVLFVNCGSVGRSKEKDRKAAYAMLTISADGISAEICKVDYPITEVANAIYESNIPDFYGDFLLLK